MSEIDERIASAGRMLRTGYLVEMSEGEILTRAREAYIAETKCPRWTARKVRAGRLDNRLRTIVTALRDIGRPMSAIIAERDEATCAIILRATPGLTELSDDQKTAVAGALMTAVRMGRRG